MFKSISWSEFIVAIVCLLICYYIFLITFYYKDVVKNVVNGKLFLKSKPYGKSVYATESLSRLNHGKGDFPATVQALLNDITTLIHKASQKQYPKEELLVALQLLLKSNASTQIDEFKYFINQYIVTECRNHCSVYLSADELNILWRRSELTPE